MAETKNPYYTDEASTHKWEYKYASLILQIYPMFSDKEELAKLHKAIQSKTLTDIWECIEMRKHLINDWLPKNPELEGDVKKIAPRITSSLITILYFSGPQRENG